MDGRPFFAWLARAALAAFWVADVLRYGLTSPRAAGEGGRGGFYSRPGRDLGHGFFELRDGGDRRGTPAALGALIRGGAKVIAAYRTQSLLIRSSPAQADAHPPHR